VLVTADPTAENPAWVARAIDAPEPLQGVSCPSVSLCAAVDYNGNALISRNPAAPTVAWGRESVDQGHLDGVSCPSRSLCVAVDSSGDVLATTDPAAADPTWRPPLNIAVSDPLVAVSCPSVLLCIAVDNAGDAWFSHDPSAVRPTWHGQPLGAGVLYGVSCGSSSLCAAVDGQGQVLLTMDAAAAQPIWSAPKTIDGAEIFGGVGCFATSFCTAVDVAGNAVQGHALGPSPAQIQTSLLKSITPHGRARTIPTLLRNDGYGDRYTALSAGTLTIDWYTPATLSPHTHGKLRRTLIASGTRAFKRPGTATITVKLNRNGKRLFKQDRRLHATAQATFTAAAQNRLVATANFTLGRMNTGMPCRGHHETEITILEVQARCTPVARSIRNGLGICDAAGSGSWTRSAEARRRPLVDGDCDVAASHVSGSRLSARRGAVEHESRAATWSSPKPPGLCALVRVSVHPTAAAVSAKGRVRH
jgi:hypothetical protein